MSTAGEEAVELAASAGVFLDPWQQDVLRAALGERPDGKWAAKRVGLVVPRQNGKGEILLARELAGLFLFGERKIMHSAHLFKTAQDAFLRIKEVIEGCDDLARRVKRIRTGHGDEGIEVFGAGRVQSLNFLARSTGGGRGLGGDLVVLDEGFELWQRNMKALIPTMSARPNPQTWITSSAPLDEDRSDVLRALCREGRKGGESLAYFEWCADVGDDYGTALAKANPALEVRVTREFIEDVERPLLDEEGFNCERLGIWVDREDADGHLPNWSACADPSSQALDPVVLCFDVTPDRKRASIGAAGRRADGRAHVELVDSRPGTGWLAKRLAELVKRQKPSAVVCDPKGPAGSVLPEVRAAGVEVVEVAASEHARSCGQLFDAVERDEVRHIGQRDLDAAVKGAQTRPLGDAWAWSRKTSDADISPLVAVTLALGRLLSHPDRAPLVAWR